jgi:hypothetical protein
MMDGTIGVESPLAGSGSPDLECGDLKLWVIEPLADAIFLWTCSPVTHR